MGGLLWVGGVSAPGGCLLHGEGVSALGGVCSRGVCSRGVSAPGGGGVSARGVSAPGGCLLLGGGVCSQGVSVLGGVCSERVVSQNALRQTPPPPCEQNDKLE